MSAEHVEYPISKCPRCGCEEFYIRQRAEGIIHYKFRFDGEEADNGEMYEGIRVESTGKFAYCVHCNKRLFKLKDTGLKL